MSTLDDRYFDLNQQWRDTFGEQIPRAELPADDALALELIERALASKSLDEIAGQIPPGAVT